MLGTQIWFGANTFVLHSIDATTGESLFASPLFTCIFASPAIAGDTLHVGTCGGVLYALDADSGAVRWSFGTESSKRDVHGILSADGTRDADKLFAGEYSYENASAAVEPLLDLGSFFSSPVPRDGVLYVGSADGHLYALTEAGRSEDRSLS